MSKWEKLDDVSKNIADEPWSLYWREFDVTSDAFRKIIDDPLAVMAEEIDEVGRDWRIQTNIIGHQIGLTRGIACYIPLVDPNTKSVYVTLYKHD